MEEDELQEDGIDVGFGVCGARGGGGGGGSPGRGVDAVVNEDAEAVDGGLERVVVSW